MDFKRTGWIVSDKQTFVEVWPQDDLKEHMLGDECWCDPKVKRLKPEYSARPMIIHNAVDNREAAEKVRSK